MSDILQSSSAFALNPILDGDSYKLSHEPGYPEEITHVYSYAEARGGEYPETTLFGTQSFVNKLIDQRITRDHIEEAEEFVRGHGFAFNRKGWEIILNEHNGHYPVAIFSADEGTIIPVSNVLASIENTDDRTKWLTSNLETRFLRHMWYSTTVATRITKMKMDIVQEWAATADDYQGLDFALLDFSSRGCAGLDANMLGGAAYLAHFKGSDSLPAIAFANHHYNDPMSGFSVPATEHSIMCSWGQEREEEAFHRLLDRMVPEGSTPVLSIVGDTWDVYRAVKYFGALAPEAHKRGIKMVFRPDSGKPATVMPDLLREIGLAYGSTRNSQGYQEFNGAALLWGDGINEHTHLEPLKIARGLSIGAKSIMTGSGGGLMQADINRDTCQFAFKASAVKQGGSWRGIAKDPITSQSKRSKKGRLALIRDEDEKFTTVSGYSDKAVPGDYLKARYINGTLLNRTTLAEVRARIDSQLRV